MPAEVEWIIKWIIKRNAADPTSGSLREEIRRGTPVVPADVGWIIKRNATDVTSASLRRNLAKTRGRYFQMQDSKSGVKPWRPN